MIKHAKAQALVEGTSLNELMEKILVKYLPKEIIIKKAQV